VRAARSEFASTPTVWLRSQARRYSNTTPSHFLQELGGRTGSATLLHTTPGQDLRLWGSSPAQW
jgi:hypothetical protein